ncbi:Release factor glutamine methyltransferase [Capillimicrobium parvum]|uniref:Release factor glutamine methyltransferase n=1 Tax=Capillimicrobium parvum TaxID=2884022 RepID=A0A9E7BXU7_9ACTN|nr:Release factor glutamine methyltransferase [Capillimicrobium parvum]
MVGGAGVSNEARRRAAFAETVRGAFIGGTVRIITFPGVFQPHSDSWLLAEQLREQTLPPRASVLDLCTGSGVLAVCAAMRGARDVTAVDVSRRAVWSARINARLNGTRIRGVRGDLFEAVGDRRFDAIVSNPPYVPAESDELPARGPQRAWEAGLTGRLILDRICDEAPRHLRPGGFVLLVHSSVCDPEQTVERLRAGGLDTDVVARRRGPLGPLLTARVSALEARGLLAAGRREEEVLVIRGRRPLGRADAAIPRAAAVTTA